MLPAAARVEHRATSVRELGMNDRLYAADMTSSGTEKMHKFKCVCIYICLRVLSFSTL